MDILINVLNVGKADAIVVWLYDNGTKESFVMLLDGGNTDDAQKVMEFLDNVIMPITKRHPDLIVCTHSDDDHIGGLIEICKKYNKTKILIHDPKIFKEIMANKTTRESLHKIASLNRLPEIEASNRWCLFGKQYINESWGISILGPTKEYYKDLIPDMKEIETYWEEENKTASARGSLDALYDLDLENILPCYSIGKSDDPSAINKSSIILMVIVNGRKYLFTGDAGIESFKKIPGWEKELEDIYFLKVPHHGSKNNISKEQIDIMKPKISAISAPGDEHHPNSALVKCLKIKKSKVYSTSETGRCLVFYTRGFEEIINAMEINDTAEDRDDNEYILM